MYEEEYRRKTVTVEYALSLLRSGDLVTIGGYGNEPRAFLKRVHTVADRLEGVKICACAFRESYPFLEDDSCAGKIDVMTFFFSPVLRTARSRGRMSEFIPNDLHMSGSCLAAREEKPRLCVMAVTPMDEDGYFYLSTSLLTEYEAMDMADIVIFEVNRRIPRLNGDCRLHISKANFLYEEDNEMPLFPSYDHDETDYQVAENAARLIRDGDTLQFGVGRIPSCIDLALTGRVDLGIHTEFFGNSMMNLMKKGVVNNSKKTLHPGKSICAFVGGDESFYDFIDGNTEISIHPARYVNNPYVIAKNDNLVSVNTALEVDLTGQICSESVGSVLYSGTGGAADFAYGAFHSNGGRGIIAMRAATGGNEISKIKAQLSPGAAVSISRNIADYIVTEYGIAKLRGATIRERAQRLIAIAHPEFRRELSQQAKEYLLW